MKRQNTNTTNARSGAEIPLLVPDTATEIKFPDIKDLASRLRFSPDDGRIWLGDRRMVLIHTMAMASLRRELIDSLGTETARGLLTRMGYIAGSRDAELARKVRPNGTYFDAFSVGPQLHALEGIVLVEPVLVQIDVEKGAFYGEFIWRDSSEDEQHISTYGIGNEPVCWTQVGYACGYASVFMGRPILFREVECRAMGYPYCRIIGKPVEEWDDAEEEMRYLQAQPFANRVPRALGAIAFPDKLTRTGDDVRGATGTSEVGETELVGASVAFNATCHRVSRVAPTRATVLLLGESGVGKEVFARTLHKISPRSDRPFVAINCAAIPEHLVEAELFGVEKGAFTGATQSRPGRFERADGGALFLDEIGALSFVAQGKLLRALQEREIERVGDSRTRKVDVRVIAATNENLRERTKSGHFREDLFYRLNVFPIHIPPLRERHDDIPLLMNFFLQKFRKLHSRPVTGFSERAIEALLNYEWPGNIRELENMIERAVILAPDEGAIDIRHLFTGEEAVPAPHLKISAESRPALPQNRTSSATQKDAQKDVLENRLTDLIRDAIASNALSLDRLTDLSVNIAAGMTNGNLAAAARLLGVSRAQIAYRLAKS